jgi:hypothetical protein
MNYDSELQSKYPPPEEAERGYLITQLKVENGRTNFEL